MHFVFNDFGMNISTEEWFESWFDSPYYHILYKNRDYKEAQRFVLNLVTHLQLPLATKCLDLACGMGRHSVLLNKEGLNVTGLDLSENNVRNAKVFENETLHFDVHDMREPYKKNQFCVIFNLFTSFGYFETKEDNLKTLSSISAMLNDGGKVVIDFMNADYAIKNLVKTEEKINSGIQFNLQRSFVGNKIIKDIRFVDDGKLYHFQEKVQAITHKDFVEMMEESGLTIIESFGNYDLAPFNVANSERLILIAKRK